MNGWRIEKLFFQITFCRFFFLHFRKCNFDVNLFSPFFSVEIPRGTLFTQRKINNNNIFGEWKKRKSVKAKFFFLLKYNIVLRENILSEITLSTSCERKEKKERNFPIGKDKWKCLNSQQAPRKTNVMRKTKRWRRIYLTYRQTASILIDWFLKSRSSQISSCSLSEWIDSRPRARPQLRATQTNKYSKTIYFPQ